MRSARNENSTARKRSHGVAGTELAVTVAAVVGLALLAWTGLLPERPTRRITAVVLLAIVVYAGFSGGVRTGLLSAGIAFLYYAAYLSLPGEIFRYRAEDVGRLVLLAVVLPAIAFIVGSLSERLWDALGREREARIAAEAGRAEAEAARAEAEVARRHIARILESISDGFVAVDEEWRFTYVNAAVEQFAGKSREELLGRIMWEVFPDQKDTRFEREYRGAMQSREPAHFQAFYRPFDAWFEVHAYPSAEGLSIYFRDITARKQVEDALRESEKRWRRLVEVSPEPIIVYRHGTFVYANRSAAEFFGAASSEDLVGRSIRELAHPDDRDGLLARERRILETGRPAPLREAKLVRLDGAVRDVETVAAAVTYEGEPAVQAVIRDVTERKRAEADLRRTAAAQGFLAETSSILTSSLDYEEILRRVARLAVPRLADWCMVDLVEDGSINRVVVTHRDPEKRHLTEELRGRPRDPNAPGGVPQAIRTGESKLIPEVTAQRFEEAARGQEELGRIARELGGRSAIIAPLRARGRTLGALTFVVAESGRRYDEDSLAVAEEVASRAAFAVDNARLYRDAAIANEAKSDFLAVMSHELRTPLNAILGFTDLLEAELAGPVTSKQRRQLERIEGNARHLLELIEEILTFSRTEEERETVRTERVDLGELVRRSAARAATLAAEKGLELHVDGPPESVSVETDPAKVRQILRNLLSNAVKFTEEGRIDLRARVEDGTIVLQVRDTGIGVTPENLEHIFESFWQAERATTRTVGGTGLGLSVARRLARLLDGDITAESTPGVGSTFTVTLPAGRSAGRERAGRAQGSPRATDADGQAISGP